MGPSRSINAVQCLVYFNRMKGFPVTARINRNTWKYKYMVTNLRLQSTLPQQESFVMSSRLAGFRWSRYIPRSKFLFDVAQVRPSIVAFFQSYYFHR